MVGAPAARKYTHRYTVAAAATLLTRAPGMLAARIVAPHDHVLWPFAALTKKVRGYAIADALETAKHDDSPDVQHTAAIACLLAGDPAEATRHLEKAARDSKSAVFWTDLGAAYYLRALQEQRDELLFASLAASSRALVLDGSRPEAAFNLALTVERMGIAPAAVDLWKNCLQFDDDRRWRAEVRRRLTALSRRQPASRSWTEIIRNGAADSTPLARAAVLYPQQSRAWAEGDCLGRWAEARRTHNAEVARRFLQQARIIGDALQKSSGESLLHDAVAAIDRAERKDDASRMHALVEGHLAYLRGKQRYHDDRPRDALDDFDRADRMLQAGRSPMSRLAAAYAASTLHELDRFAEAGQRLGELSAETERHDSSHLALRAQIRYQIARLDAIRGYWSDALTASAEATALYHRCGEGGHEGMAALLVAETYDFVGQPSVAIQHGTTSIRLLADAGDTYRLRVIAAVLCRSFMRRKDWDGAYGIVRIEHALASLSPDPVLTTDTFLRAAIIDHNLGRTAGAERMMGNAVAEASRVTDVALRASLLADVTGARGVLARERKPIESVSYLGQSIEYLECTERAIQLPQLYLERGRAQLMIGHPAQALVDFERGIARLESQRSHVAATMRYGIFDDIHELFSEAATLYLRAGNRDDAFRTVERSRARSLAEQIAHARHGATSLPTLASVGRRLPKGTLLVEYVFLHDSLRIFAVSNDLVDVHEVHADVHATVAKSDAFVQALAERHPVDEVEKIAAELYALLIAPVPEHSRYAKLVIVPDPLLQQLPFAALFDPRQREFLVQQNLIVTDPSAAVFLESRGRAPYVATAPATAAVFIGGRGTRTMRLRPLPELEREAADVAAAYPSSALIKGRQASVERFLTEAPRNDVVHFGGHALLDPFDPAYSALVLATRPNGEAGLLDCAHIGAASLGRPRTVVLAACSTIRGRDGRGEGTPSLARSFLAAGVPTVVGTLWDIDDAETSVLITNFHRNVARGTPPAAALRAAQLKALKNPYPAASHPGSWAAFAVLGSGGF
jgi:CHAT domain-containing protein